MIIDVLKYQRLLPHSLGEYDEYCQKHAEGELRFLFIKDFLVWTKSVSQLHLLLLSIGVIYVKNADDILSSVNNLDKLLHHLKAKFNVTCHENVSLYTIRNYSEISIQQLEVDKTILLKQLTQGTVQMVTL